MPQLDALKTAVINGKRKDVLALVPELLAEGHTPVILLEDALIPAMAEVGERFKNNDIFVPEMLVSARAMKEAMKIIEPALLAAGVKPKYTAIIGTVEGDLHDIGKNLVATMWKGAGFEVVDLGVNVGPDRFLAAIDDHKPDLVGLSALLTTTMPAMKETVRIIREAGHTNLNILVGGAPITEKYALDIGANAYAGDAASAVDVAKSLLNA